MTRLTPRPRRTKWPMTRLTPRPRRTRWPVTRLTPRPRRTRCPTVIFFIPNGRWFPALVIPVAPVSQRVRDRPRGLGHVTEHAEVDRPVRAQRA
ncbi:MAG TPA: hypothetical protein VGY96_26860, partial [Streptosporangiaceae bacterium]|nr:hypothetical protein [Streptosporangiaceae bacterium]